MFLTKNVDWRVYMFFLMFPSGYLRHSLNDNSLFMFTTTICYSQKILHH